MRIGVHPVPDGLLEGDHEDQMGVLLELPELGDGLSHQLGQAADVHVYVLDELDVGVVLSLLVGHRELLEAAGDAGEDGPEVVEGEGEEDLGGEVPELVPAGVGVAGPLPRAVEELADLPQQQLHIHRLVVLDGGGVHGLADD